MYFVVGPSQLRSAFFFDAKLEDDRTQGPVTSTMSVHDNNACRWSCSTSCEAGVSPSAPWAKGNSRSEAPTARACRPREKPHLRRHACSTRRRKMWFSHLALALASWVKNDRVSSEKRPPTSTPSTTKRARARLRPVQDMWPLCAFVLLSLWPHLPQRLGWWADHPSAAHTPKWCRQPIGHR